MESLKNFALLFYIAYILNCLTYSFCSKQSIGSCSFEGSDWLCSYNQPHTNNFNWSRVLMRDTHAMKVDAARRSIGESAKLITPEIKLQETHCVTFDTYIMEQKSIDTAESSMKLNVFLQDKKAANARQPIWTSNGLKWNRWETIQLALTPRDYKIVFEAVVTNAGTGAILIDNVLVNTLPCESAPHFLRLSQKTVNKGQNVTVQCSLWGHSGPDTRVILQKSTGEKKFPTSKREINDHLFANFTFSNVDLPSNGSYRCVSGNSNQIGVSNYALFTVRTPPSPRRGPQVVTPGATNFVVKPNAEDYVGDGPIVKTVLTYRPVHGSWTDVHLISKSVYQLWHLQPDTEYELAVTLARPGPGGEGLPGPTLVKKTKCGRPTTSVQNLVLTSLPKNPYAMRIQWDAPDFSVTQCHNYACVVKYKSYSENSDFKSQRVEKNNSAVIGGLKPFQKYSFKVELLNSAERGSKETGEYIAQTAEAAPGPIPPDSLIVTKVNETSVVLSWSEPQETNGKLVQYEISHIGTNTSDPNFNASSDKGLYQTKATELRLELTHLHSGTTYRFSIKAQTSAGFGPSVSVSATTKIARPILPVYPPLSSDPEKSNFTVSPTTIEIPVIPAQSNGAPITKYYIIVAEDISKSANSRRTAKAKKESRKGRRRKKSRNKRSLDFLIRLKRQSSTDEGDGADASNSCYDAPVSYEEAALKQLPHYATAKFEPEQVQQEFKFVIGDNSQRNGFLNPPLDPNKDYKIYVRVESEANGKKTVNCALVAFKVHVPPTTSPPTTPPSAFPTDESDKNVPNTNTDEKDSGSTSTNSPDAIPPEPSEQDQIMLYAGVGAAILSVLIITILIILFVMRRKRSKRKDDDANPFEVQMMMSDMTSPAHTLLPIHQSENSDRQALMPDVVGYEHQDFLDKTSEGASGYAAPSNDERFAVRVDDFHVHVSQMKSSGGYGFRDEYSTFPDGPNAPWTVAQNPVNKRRNRYGNIMAYDHSRVVLDPPEGYEEEFESDYINASYINGYRSPSMYVAAQAPTPDTSNDFWWMIWQEKSTVVVMVTNLVELGKQKCHKYWPDDRATYGTIEVSLNSEERLSDHVVRTFILQQVDGYDVRELKQFHFTSWPDHGVPSRPTNLLSFIKRVKSYEPQGQGPMIVHCSAGSGRTGCFIVIDMMLDMAREEEIVDIYNTVKELRSRRVNMVQTEEQYVFVHEAVLEALLCGETLVPAVELEQHYDDLITLDPQSHFAPIQEEFETLHLITPKVTDEECSVARLPRNRANNRFMDVLPADRHLAFLVTPDPQDRDNNYINAVFVDSYTTQNSFLVSQMPLPNTVVDIWRLLYDHNCSSIVMMNDVSEHDQTCSQYWPDSGSAIFGPFTVELLTKDDEVDVIVRLFKIQNVNKPGEPYRLVHQFQLTDWPAAQPVPYARNSLLRIIQLVTSWRKESARNGEAGRTLVHCVAGAGRSGTFVSCFNICEQLQHENTVDVFNIVQRLRNVRPQLVETLEQYRFCYEVGIEFAKR